MKEQQLETHLCWAIRRIGGICWKFTSPGLTGVPDRICMMDGKCVFVEVKTTGKQPRPLQIARMKELQRQGFTCIVLDHPDEIQEVCDALQAA